MRSGGGGQWTKEEGPRAQATTFLSTSAFFTAHPLPTHTSLDDSEQSPRLHRDHLKNPVYVISKNHGIFPESCAS